MISRFLRNINRDKKSLGTKFCSVCVFLVATLSKLFALVFDFFGFPLLPNNVRSCTKLADLRFIHLRYQPKAEIANDKLRLDNSSCHMKTEFNNCFIIYFKKMKKLAVVGHI